MATTLLDEFLRPLRIDVPKIHSLARSLCVTYTSLAAESQEQFLPTPVSEEVLRPKREGRGKFLAIDIGGTNLRVGFIELLGSDQANSSPQVSNIESQNHDAPPTSSRVLRHKHLEKSWPIGEHLKQEKAEDLFAWIGRRIAEVVKEGCDTWPYSFTEIPLGVSFSFPMIQETLSEAKIMAMGKGFAITTNSNLGQQLQAGYERARSESQTSLPPIKIVAITNDAVATLISFTYQHRCAQTRKAAMGLIAGTGSNATIPLSINKLHPSKQLLSSALSPDAKITINTEWTISGASAPLRELSFFTKWDQLLDAQCDAPGFQPFEYMTSGRYLGELGRIIIYEFLTTSLHISSSSLPPKLQQRHGLTTSFLGNLGPHLAALEGENMVRQLERELPSENEAFVWTEELAEVVFRIAKMVQVRAAGMTAAAVVGLLGCADELHLSSSSTSSTSTLPNHITTATTYISTPLTNGITNGTNHTNHTKPAPEPQLQELMVGYTGGCIVHFQNYLSDCQLFLDEIMAAEFRDKSVHVPRIVLMPCHDGGILGAGILAGTVVGMQREMEKGRGGRGL